MLITLPYLKLESMLENIHEAASIILPTLNCTVGTALSAATYLLDGFSRGVVRQKAIYISNVSGHMWLH